MPASRLIAQTIAIIVLKTQGAPLGAEGFMCAGHGLDRSSTSGVRVAAKVAQRSKEGTRSAVVIFAHFKGELPGVRKPPEWAAGLFDADKPGSFSHFYDTMSFGKLRVRGEIAPRGGTGRTASQVPISPMIR